MCYFSNLHWLKLIFSSFFFLDSKICDSIEDPGRYLVMHKDIVGHILSISELLQVVIAPLLSTELLSSGIKSCRVFVISSYVISWATSALVPHHGMSCRVMLSYMISWAMLAHHTSFHFTPWHVMSCDIIFNISSPCVISSHIMSFYRISS